MKKLQQNLLNWFDENARELPWRQTYSPYHVWISEIMLQQTQMDRVVTYFNKWMKRFPDISSIPGATEEEVLKLWEGLGYYSRPKNIIKTAQILVDEYSGKLPADHKELIGLPGIGPYTAGAIMSIAFNREYAIVDANIERVFARYGIAHLVAGMKPFLGFTGITWVALWGHVVYALVAAAVLETRGVVMDLPARRAVAIG